MRKKLLAATAAVMALSLGAPAQADEIMTFSLSGGGISASGAVTFTPDTIAGDPVGANLITGISGIFSDLNAGLSDVAITGLVATNPTTANAPFATSLSRVPVQGSLLPAHDNNSLTYSNLFYPNGAPDTCFDGITGGFLDVFGALLTLYNGDEVNLWSNGGGANDSAMYGLALAAPSTTVGSPTVYTATDYISNGVTMDAPEPGSLWLLAPALLGALTLTLTRRAADSRRVASMRG